MMTKTMMILLPALCTAPALADTIEPSPPPKTAANTTLDSVDDRQFVLEAASGGMAEAELGRLAQKRAMSPEVKSFAKMMVNDHTRANKELARIATKKKFPLPTAVTSEQKKTYNELSELKGKDFDEKFMEVMVQEHDKTIDLFQKVVDKGEDSELRAFAGKTLPTLKKHYEHAKSTEKKVD